MGFSFFIWNTIFNFFNFYRLHRTVSSGLSNVKLWVQRRWDREEHKKVVISRSIWVALTRCGVHFLSVSISILLIALNLRHVYIGINFQSIITYETINIALLQIAAKIQELLVVASLSTIIFHLVRDEMLYGDGLPLGLLGAGFDFDKVNYFWSSQLWGSLGYKTKRNLRKIGLLVFLVLAGITATLAGPSCAVLLVPQPQSWSAGGTTIYVNGSKEDLWPTKLSASKSTLGSLCTSMNSTKYGVCPSGGFYSLWAHYSGTNYSTFMNSVQPYAQPLSGNSCYWPVGSTKPIDAQLISIGIPRGDLSPGSRTFIVQPHLGAAVLVQHTMRDWWSVLTSDRAFQANNIDDRMAFAEVYSAITYVRCSAAQNLSASDNIITFPSANLQKFPFGQNLTLSTLKNLTSDQLRFSWTQLPETFGPVSVGAVLESPWSDDGLSRVVVGCTVKANWVPTQIRSDKYSFWQGWYPWNITFSELYPADGSTLGNESFENNKGGAIAVDQTWLDALTPRSPVQTSADSVSETSTIETILTDSGIVDGLFTEDGRSQTELWQDEGTHNGNRTNYLETIVCSVFNDGLARAGSHRIFNTSGPPSSWSFANYEKRSNFDTAILRGYDAFQTPAIPADSITELSVHFLIGGLSYQASLATYLAMAVLCFHILMASLHTLWTLWRHETSGSWSSVTEVIALAQNSRPAYSALENTAGGISRLSTFGRKAVIRSTKLPLKDEADHLEFIFEDARIPVETQLGDISYRESRYSSQVPLDSITVLENEETEPDDQRYHLGVVSADHAPGSATLDLPRWPAAKRRSAASSVSSGYTDAYRASSGSALLLNDADSLGSFPPPNERVMVGCKYG